VSPIRSDVVQEIHTLMNKNHRQAYAVYYKAGHDTSASSWGTGRAVSRIPRVGGSGTHRSGQGAFGNMCRKGRMFAPTKTYRRWHRKISKGQRRYATCAALAASASLPLVQARGHRVTQLPEIPFVVADSELGFSKTRDAVALLKKYGAYEDVERVIDSHSIRRGAGKSRNRRYVQRRGPLFIHNNESRSEIVRAMRNVPGVDVANVTRLNLLQLAPGGHLGRFIIWTESAFKELDNVFGTCTQTSTQKSGFKVPRSIMTNADIGRIINSSEVQSVIRPVRPKPRRSIRKKNPLKNFGAMVKLNPFALTQRRRAIHQAQKGRTARRTRVNANRDTFMTILKTPAIAPERGEDEFPTQY